MFALVYSEGFGGDNIVMETNRSWNKLYKELKRLIDKEDYPCWAMQIVDLNDLEIDHGNSSWKGLKF